MLNNRVRRLEKKYIREDRVCIVMPGGSKKNALIKLKTQLEQSKDIFFIKIEGV